MVWFAPLMQLYTPRLGVRSRPAFALLLALAVALSAPGSRAAEAAVTNAVPCEGTFPLHLQGIATDGRTAIFWSWTDALAKTDLQGRLL